MASQLKNVNIELSDDYLIQFVLSSLLSTFTPFKVGYFKNPQKWTINELILMCDCEERRMKQEGLVTVNLVPNTKFKDMKNKGNSSKKGKWKERWGEWWSAKNASFVGKKATLRKIV